jgi:hypothetical protein
MASQEAKRSREAREGAGEALRHARTHIAEGMPPAEQSREREARQARELILRAPSERRGAEIIAFREPALWSQPDLRSLSLGLNLPCAALLSRVAPLDLDCGAFHVLHACKVPWRRRDGVAFVNDAAVAWQADAREKQRDKPAPKGRLPPPRPKLLLLKLGSFCQNANIIAGYSFPKRGIKQSPRDTLGTVDYAPN